MSAALAQVQEAILRLPAMAQDHGRCVRCGGRDVLQEVTRAGYAATFCVACKHQEVVIPYRVAPPAPPETAGSPPPTVTEPCLVCGADVVTEWRRGVQRPLACGHHTVAEVEAVLQRQADGKLTCVTPGCRGAARSRGKCRSCYAKWWRRMQRLVTGA